MGGSKGVATLEFPGNGILKCAVCGRPYIEHDIAPCPELNQAVIYAKAPHGTKPISSPHCLNCGKETPKRKKGGGYNMYCSANCRKIRSRNYGG